MTKIRLANALEMADTIAENYKTALEAGDTFAADRHLAAYNRLIERLGFDPLA